MRRPQDGRWRNWVDNLICFQPARWAQAERNSRITALLIVAAFLIFRVWQFDRFPQTWSHAQRFYGAFRAPDGTPVYSGEVIALVWILKLAVWAIESGIFVGYIAAYISRAPARSRAGGVMETAFPVVVAGLPLLMALAPYTLPHWAPPASPRHLMFFLSAMTLMLLGGLLNLIGLLTLRRAFTIMTEARVLITRGIFRHMRHPLYTGHFIMFLGTLLLRWHWTTLLLYLLFSIGQIKRARLEERKLLAVFPEYQAYCKGTGMFWPRWRRRA